MKENNVTILTKSKGHIRYIEELLKEGFKDNKIIAADTRQANSLIGKIIYHETTYYKGLTLKIFNNERVSIESNYLIPAEAELFNHVRDLEKSIEDFGNNIWANRFELDDEEAAKELEVERDEIQEILNDLKPVKEKIVQKNRDKLSNV